jgi:hypothetical protein
LDLNLKNKALKNILNTAIMKKIVMPLFLSLLIVSCGPSTKIEKTWMEPGASISQSPENKTLIIAMVKDETSRRVIEDELQKRLKSKSVPSYTVLTPEILKDGNDKILDSVLKQGQYTHILLMRLADIEKETSYVPGTTSGFYGGYGMYYGYGASFYSSPGYYTTDKNYFIETTVYDVRTNKLLWTGTTKTVNPSNIKNTINDIADLVTQKMKKEGFLQ